MHQLTPNCIVCLGIFIWAYEAMEVTPRLMHSIGFMTYIIRQMLRTRQRLNPQIAFTTTSDATTLSTARTQLLRFSHTGRGDTMIE